MFGNVENSVSRIVRRLSRFFWIQDEVYVQHRSDESEWDQMLNFMKRKMERFVKTMTFELSIPTSEIGHNGAYEPRFLDEIADEINTLEDKKDTLFCKYLRWYTTCERSS